MASKKKPKTKKQKDLERFIREQEKAPRVDRLWKVS